MEDPTHLKAEARKSSTQCIQRRQDTAWSPPKGSRRATDFQLFARTDKREPGSTRSGILLTAAPKHFCSKKKKKKIAADHLFYIQQLYKSLDINIICVKSD